MTEPESDSTTQTTQASRTFDAFMQKAHTEEPARDNTHTRTRPGY